MGDTRQRDLFAQPVEAQTFERPTLHARTSDPATSRASMKASEAQVGAAMALVVALHEKHGPLADFELEALFYPAYGAQACDHLHQQARRSAADQGRIKDTGVVKVNPATGRRQIVWAACNEPKPTIEKCDKCGHVLRRKEGGQ